MGGWLNKTVNTRGWRGLNQNTRVGGGGWGFEQNSKISRVEVPRLGGGGGVEKNSKH